jgi:hypothetical protein
VHGPSAPCPAVLSPNQASTPSSGTVDRAAGPRRLQTAPRLLRVVQRALLREAGGAGPPVSPVATIDGVQRTCAS